MQTKTEKQTAITRRQFIQIAASASIMTASSSLLFAKKAKGEVPRRTLGRTGEKVSAIGLGGFHIGISAITETQSVRIIRTAIDNGINFLDNCWDYNEGQSEIRMGKALRNSYRKKAFLMSKIDGGWDRSTGNCLHLDLNSKLALVTGPTNSGLLGLACRGVMSSNSVPVISSRLYLKGVMTMDC